MHELSIARSVVDVAGRRAEGRPVLLVHLRVGALRQVVPAALSLAFEVTARGGPCEGAVLEKELVPARVRCRDCDAEAELSEPAFHCAGCGGGVDVVAGEELQVDFIEIEEDAPACTG